MSAFASSGKLAQRIENTAAAAHTDSAALMRARFGETLSFRCSFLHQKKVRNKIVLFEFPSADINAPQM